jgi:uncharacterized protein with von Willebrand factor type A (vWA) domain
VHSSGLGPRPGIAGRLAEFTEELRGEGVAIGTSELLDGLAALELISWSEPEQFRGALAATLAKSPEDRHVFDAVFDRFFFRATELAAIEEGVTEQGTGGAEGEHSEQFDVDPDALRRAIAEAIAAGDEAAMADLARLAIAAFGQQGVGTGVVGVDVQRIRRQLALRSEPQPDYPPEDPRSDGLPRDQLRQFEALLRAELERAQIERTGELPPARPLNDLARALPSGPLQDLAAVHRVTQQMKRKLKTQGQETRGRKRQTHVDMRRTMRASLAYGGVPVELKMRPARPRRPELFVLCDVSTSVTSSSVFFLSVMHALHDAFRKMRSFVFIERVAEVTEIFEQERDFKAVNQAIAQQSGVADISGYTDYGRVWTEFHDLVVSDLHPRSTIIVLGDARSNGRPPRADLFAAVAEKAGRTFWLNPEPYLYWNYGDSVIAQYAEHCEAHECWTVAHLERFVGALVSPPSDRW